MCCSNSLWKSGFQVRIDVERSSLASSQLFRFIWKMLDEWGQGFAHAPFCYENQKRLCHKGGIFQIDPVIFSPSYFSFNFWKVLLILAMRRLFFSVNCFKHWKTRHNFVSSAKFITSQPIIFQNNKIWLYGWNLQIFKQKQVPPESPLGGSLSLYVTSGQRNKESLKRLDACAGIMSGWFLLYLCFNSLKREKR